MLRFDVSPRDRRPWAAGFVSLLLLSACGGGGGGSTPPLEPPASRPEALAASRPGELLAFMKQRLDRRWAAGLQGSSQTLYATDVMVTASGTAAPAAFSSTTLQEQGVDEDDLLKTDGSRIFSLVLPGTAGALDTRLLAHQRQIDGRALALGTLTLPSTAGIYASAFAQGIHLSASGKRVAVTGQGWISGPGSPCPPGMMCIADSLLPFAPYEVREQVSVDVVDVAQPAAMRIESRIAIDGNLVGTRRIGDALYVVSSWSPRLAVDALPLSTPAADRNALMAKLSTGDLLPGIRINGGPSQPLVQDTECWLQATNASVDLRLTTITRFDLASPTLERSSRCTVGGSEALYMSTSTLVLATTRDPYTVNNGVLRYLPAAATDIHMFGLGGTAVDYRGSGSVPGHLGWATDQKSLRISEHKGDLRVLSFTGEVGWAVVAIDSFVPPEPASPATLTVLRERSSDRSLQVVGQLPNAQRPQWIGHAGEQVYAVRFAGERAYVVTFRRTDPLYVLDLANPADPRIAGELQAPGFSDYLYPLPNGLLFGVGRDATPEGRATGIKVGLYDVSDASQPKELAVRSFGEASSSTALGYSRHGINLFTQGDVTRIALPMFVRDSAPSKSLQGLQRFEVDSTKKSLLVKPMLGPVQTEYEDMGDPLWNQRTVQIGAQVYWLTRGTLGGWDW